MGLQTSFSERLLVYTVIFHRCLPPSLSANFRHASSRSSSGIHTLPHNAKVHYNYANFLKDGGRHQEAIYHYTIALRSDPKLSHCFTPTHPSSHYIRLILFLYNSCTVCYNPFTITKCALCEECELCSAWTVTFKETCISTPFFPSVTWYRDVWTMDKSEE